MWLRRVRVQESEAGDGMVEVCGDRAWLPTFHTSWASGSSDSALYLHSQRTYVMLLPNDKASVHLQQKRAH